MFYRVLVFALILPAVAFSYTVVGKDGKIFSGELIQQTPEITILKGKDGITIRFRSEQIDWNQTTVEIRNEEKTRTTELKFRELNYQTKEITKPKKWTGEPFSFDFKDIDIKDLFRFIADISGLNVILDPSVKGTITLKLTNVPWDQALDLITKNESLAYTIEGNVIRIAPLSKISQEAKTRIEAEKQKMLSGPVVTKIKRLSYAKARDMEPIVKKFLSPKGSCIVDARTNTLIITDIDTNIDAVVNLVDNLD